MLYFLAGTPFGLWRIKTLYIVVSYNTGTLYNIIIIIIICNNAERRPSIARERRTDNIIYYYIIALWTARASEREIERRRLDYVAARRARSEPVCPEATARWQRGIWGLASVGQNEVGVRI